MENKEVGELKLTYDSTNETVFIVKFIGNAPNEIVEDLSSSCVRALIEFSGDYTSRPPLEYIISKKKMWQQTSLCAMVRFSPNCTVVAVEDNVCLHLQTTASEDHFFAPTGNGSIVTTTCCATCGVQLSKTSEYFD